ncbi:hypothetical protein AOCH_002701 [Aspergillus ochraceoroseus]|uniref:Mechanosensitive ion channel protein n=1 Tax=Aspergillus ochraceoroseus TaxID=138278 RepID=A0A0F8W854_9EURO|nr:hypothetical protein AOCH_002701 [Aspergillus ochraceoroseus]
MSGRPGLTEKRLSAHRFQQIPDHTPDTMHNPNDVTIDIPLTSVSSRGQTGARNNNSEDVTAHTNTSEKAGLVSLPPSSHGFGHRRRKIIDEASGRALDDPEDGTVTRMGRIYQAVLNFSFVTRYMIYVAPVALLIAIPIIAGATVAENAKIGGVSLPWFFCWIEVVWVSLWVCKIVARCLPYLFQFLCGIVSSGTRKYALILRNLEIPITTVLWMIVSLVTFLPVMTQNPRKQAEGDTSTKDWEKSVKNVLFALLLCSLIFLGEKTIVQLISISYHRKQFDTKIKESKRNIYLVETLYDASRSMFPMYCKEFRDDDAIISDSILAQAPDVRPGHLRTSSSAPLRLIRGVGQGVGQIRGKITAAIGDVAHEITGKQVFNSATARSVVTEALERRRSTEALARRIWMSFVVEGREALFFDDIVEVLGAGKDTEAEECFMMLDRDGNGDISLDEMVLAITEIGRMRKSLNHSLHDVDQAIHVLDNLLVTVAFIIGVLVFISFVTSGFGTVIAAGATSLLSLSFIFSTTAQEVLGSCIFLFVKHPFDIGDRVEVNSLPYVVERISLLFSVFRSVTDHRVTQVPNAVLNTLWIDNFTRSKAMQEKLTVHVSFDTTFADIQLLKDELETFVRDKDNSRDFQPDVEVDVAGVGDMDKLELTVHICHKSNWSNEAIRVARRSKFMCALVAAVRKIPLHAPGYTPPEETSADDSEDKPDEQPDEKASKPAANQQYTATEGAHRLAVPDTSFTDSSRSTGFDLGRAASIQRRGAAAAAASMGSSYSDGAYNNMSTSTSGNELGLRSLSPSGADGSHDGDSYQTPGVSPRQDQQLGVHYGSLTREPSTGRRKEGTQPPYSYGTSGVPIINEPTPPSRLQGPPQPEPQQEQPASDPYPYPGHYYEGAEDSSQPLELPSGMDTSRPQQHRQYPSYSASAAASHQTEAEERERNYMSQHPYGS